MCVEMIIHLISQPTKKEQNFYRPFLFKHIVILFSIAVLLFIENVCTFNDSNNINNSKTNLTLSNHVILLNHNCCTSNKHIRTYLILFLKINH